MKVHGHRGGKGVDGKETRSPTYNSWRAMLERCYREKHARYPRYGGRGIEVCDRWRFGEGGVSAFLCFLADMGTRPTLEHTLEREQTNGHYSKANCSWQTIAVQNANRSNTKLVEFRGEMMTIRAAHTLASCQLPFGSVVDRVARGWDLALALVTPMRTKKRRTHRA